MTSKIIVVREKPDKPGHPPLFVAPTELFNQIKEAAFWCDTSIYDFIEMAIKEELDKVKMAIGEIK